MKLSVIIVNYNVKYFIEVCLHSVQKAARGMDAEVIVVDNNSQDGSGEMIREKFPEITLIENKDNKGFSKANNQGVAIAKGEYILFINPDTVMPEDFLQKLCGYLDEHPEAGSVGPKLIDGRGNYAPDGKKSFPSLSVAIFKTTGINKIFSKSPYFNKYYAVHVDKDQTAEVDMLSGCCMMVRRKVIDEIGGAFDESYFMYCEDFDLSYRIQKSGYKNVYYPETTLIHYKGESTRKATISHVRIFNDALSTFVRKHYSKSHARLFIMLINVGIVLRAIFSVLKQVLKVLRMPLFDALILLGTLILMTQFWVEEVKNILPIPLDLLLKTFPVYILLWVLSLYFNGVYDQSYRAVRVVRGMAIGTVIILAYYGLLPPELRYSRAIIIFSGFIGTVGMLGLHGLLYRLGIFKFIPYDHIPGKAVVVATSETYTQTMGTLREVNYAPELIGRIEPKDEKGNAITTLKDLNKFAYTAEVDEIIYCINGLSYQDVFDSMQLCGTEYEYKIHVAGSMSFVGSNSSQTAGDLYTLDKRYNLSDFAKQRNKRIIDVLSSLIFIILSPVLLFFCKKPGGLIRNSLSVLFGKQTWIGYSLRQDKLPMIRKGVLPPYNILDGYVPDEQIKQELDNTYARKYTSGTDVKLLIDNFKYLGGF
ncbi:MAG: glycosyltransferase [Chitinophagales bacterium]|nr:glycosyltransferase [Chitinophagaceae bacterium]MCB9065166.1 glycosyltransferase [Chitinophagales bacterium]